MTIPDALIHKNLQPEDTLIAYHKGDQYCERVSPAKIDIHNAEHIHQRPYKNCYRYHNNTAVCQKMQEPHCKYAVGSIKTALQKSGIHPEIIKKQIINYIHNYTFHVKLTH